LHDTLVPLVLLPSNAYNHGRGTGWLHLLALVSFQSSVELSLVETTSSRFVRGACRFSSYCVPQRISNSFPASYAIEEFALSGLQISLALRIR
jgi:hypothetical protein